MTSGLVIIMLQVEKDIPPALGYSIQKACLVSLHYNNFHLSYNLVFDEKCG